MEIPKPIFNIINPADRVEARLLFLRSSFDLPLPPMRNGGDAGYIALLRDKEALFIGSYFNSFYDYEFQKITGNSSISLSLFLQGRAIVRVIRDNPGGRMEVPYEGILETDNPEWFHIDIPLANIGDARPGSRLRIELHTTGFMSLESTVEATLLQAYWGTRESMKREVKLGVVMCTYNNEQLCLNNLQRLLSSGILEKEDINFLLIDNGSSLKSKVPKHDRLHYISQRNLGGAGGFGRGLKELVHGAYASLGVSHILLMDDDLSIEPEMISRASRLHEYTQQDCVIGGAMLNLKIPNELYETGAFSSREQPFVVTTNNERGPAHELNTLDLIGQATEFDYNAWWFCSLSIDSVKEIGLPKPLFIHGDDMEYGERLRCSGRKIYCASGIGVWHDPFDSKPVTWMQYFDIRNLLILMATTHDPRNWSADEICWQLKKWISQNIMRYDYGRAAMIIEGVEDFMKGPAILDKLSSPHRVSELIDAYNKCNAPKEEGQSIKIKPREPKTRSGKSRLSNFLKSKTYNYQLYVAIKSKHTHYTSQTEPVWKNIHAGSDVLVENKRLNIRRHFIKNPTTAKALVKRMRVLLPALRNQYSHCNKEWKSQQDVLHTLKFWDAYTNSDCLDED